MNAPHEFRMKHGPFATTAIDGANGVFEIPNPTLQGHFLFVIASDGMGWDHVSVSVGQRNQSQQRCPTWEEMCYVKDLFWHEDETVMQLHPRKEDYVNQHPFCLHLWRPQEDIIPTPPPIMVGVKK